MRGAISSAVAFSLSVFIAAAGLSRASGGQQVAAVSGCLQCHEGIESIGKAHENLECLDCHGGESDVSTKEAAHLGLRRNPGNLEAVDDLCAVCHAREVEGVKKS